MQTSKVRIGDTYAIVVGRRTVRFHVEAIVSRKLQNKGNAANSIEGHIHSEDRLDEGDDKLLSVEASALIWPFEEVAELRAKAVAERAEEYRIATEEKADRVALFELLHALIGKPTTATLTGSEHYRLCSYGVDILKPGVKPLLAALRGAKDALDRDA